MKMRIEVCNVLLSLVENSVFYLNEKKVYLLLLLLDNWV